MRILRFLALIAPCLALSCGLEAPFSLNPPGGPAQPATLTNRIFQIVKTTANNEGDLLGFELYYKLYKDQTVEANLGGGDFTELDLRVTYGFRPLYVYKGPDTPGNHQRPLVEIDPADIDIAIGLEADFETNPGAPFILYNDARIELGRSVQNEIKRFAPAVDFDSQDEDIKTIWADLSGDVYIAIYALSYGRRDISTEIWSSPVYLGYTVLPI